MVSCFRVETMQESVLRSTLDSICLKSLRDIRITNRIMLDREEPAKPPEEPKMLPLTQTQMQLEETKTLAILQVATTSISEEFLQTSL